MGRKERLKKEKRHQFKKILQEEINQRRKSKDPFFAFWCKWTFWIYIFGILALVVYPFYNNYLEKKQDAKEDEAILQTSMGEITLKFFEQDAPNTVSNFKTLAMKGFYDGLTFHRVIEHFMIQGGDPNGDGTGGPGYYFDDEINNHKIIAGSVAMANAGENTNGSQFFIVTEENQPDLDGKYTVFGEVTSGLEVAIEISKVAKDKDDKPITPVYINSVKFK